MLPFGMAGGRTSNRALGHAVIFGAHGGLATALSSAFVSSDWSARQVGRFDPTPNYPADVYVFPQGRFLQKPFVDTNPVERSQMVDAGLNVILSRLRDCLAIRTDQRTDYCLIGSTSSYQGFANSAIYCAVKHALVGLVRALNDEYKDTSRRFWLFSMGTMDTAMGRQLTTDQDPNTFLSPDEVAERIVSTVTNPSNLFEPEVVIRRRTVA